MDTVARYGGEEFAVILPETETEAACQAAERLREVVALLALTSGPGAVTVSLGVAVTRAPAATPEGLIQAADVALYRAKRSGKNRVVLHVNSSERDAATRL